MAKENLETKKSLELIAKSAVIVFAGVLLSKIFTYWYRIIIAREFGPEIYGTFVLAIMIVGWLMAISIAGLHQGLDRFLPIYFRKSNSGISKYLIVKSAKFMLATSIFSAVLIFSLSDLITIHIFHEEKLSIFLKILSITIPLGTLSGIFRSILRSHERIGLYSFLTNIIPNLLNLAILLLLLFFGYGANSVSISYLFGALISFVMSYIITVKCYPNLLKGAGGILKSKPKKGDLVYGDLVKYSLPLLVFGIVGTIFFWTDTFVIGLFLGVKEVGFYNAALPIALLIYVSRELFVQLFFPLVSKEYGSGNIKLIQTLTKQVGRWVLVLSFPAFLLMAVFPEILINILFGQEYLIAVNTLRILAMGTLVASVLGISSDVLLIIGKSKLLLKDVVVTGLINLVLNIYLVPKFGIEGAAISTTFSLFFLNMLYLIQVWNALKINPLSSKMAQIIISGLISTIMLVILKNAFFSNNLGNMLFVSLVLIFLICYIVVLILIKGLDKNDLFIIESIKKRIGIKKVEKRG